MFRKKAPAEQLKRSRDPLRDHRKKHLIAVRPTTFMGRLPRLLGPNVCKRLQKEAESGGLVELRERALYVYADAQGVTTPASSITFERAHEILLLALEVADDLVVGWTDASYRFGPRFESWIADLTGATGSDGR